MFLPEDATRIGCTSPDLHQRFVGLRRRLDELGAHLRHPVRHVRGNVDGRARPFAVGAVLVCLAGNEVDDALEIVALTDG